MAGVLLDTTILIDLLRGRRGAVDRLRNLVVGGDVPYVCAINVDETVRGLRAGEESAARRLFAGLRTAQLGEREGWRAGEWRREYAERPAHPRTGRLPDRSRGRGSRRTTCDGECGGLPVPRATDRPLACRRLATREWGAHLGDSLAPHGEVTAPAEVMDAV